MPTSNQRNVHLHLVDISRGWHICKSLTTAEFADYRQTRVYTEDDQPLEDIGSIHSHTELILSLLSARDVQADDPQAMGGFMLFTSLLEARLADEVVPSEYVRSTGDWILALVRPPLDASGPILLITDLVERSGEVPLTGAALEHAVSTMLLRAVPVGASLEQFELHERFRPAGPDQLA